MNLQSASCLTRDKAGNSFCDIYTGEHSIQARNFLGTHARIISAPDEDEGWRKTVSCLPSRRSVAFGTAWLSDRPQAKSFTAKPDHSACPSRCLASVTSAGKTFLTIVLVSQVIRDICSRRLCSSFGRGSGGSVGARPVEMLFLFGVSWLLPGLARLAAALLPTSCN